MPVRIAVFFIICAKVSATIGIFLNNSDDTLTEALLLVGIKIIGRDWYQ